jgi:hypothetical protein
LFNLRPLLFAPVADEERAAPGQPAAAEGKQPDAGALQKQIDDLKKQNTTLEQESRTWHGRYQELDHARKVGGANPKGGDPDDEDEDESDQDEVPELEVKLPEGKMLDDLSKGEIGSLVSKGVLTKKDAAALIDKQARKIVREEINRTRTTMTHEQKLLKAHPSIDDPESELFKAVRAHIQLKGNPTRYRDPETFADAVDLVAERLKASKPANNGNNRAAAIAAQQGSTNGGGSNFEEEDDDNLSDTQRKMLDAFNSDGELTVSEANFKKRARAGVKMDGATAFAMHSFEKRGGRRG